MVSNCYTYQGGRKLHLRRATDRFISRASRQELLEHHFEPIEPLSAHSWAVRTDRRRLQEDLGRARKLAPAYDSYVIAETGTHLLVTDRIFIRFRHTDDAAEDAAISFGVSNGLTLIRRLGPHDCLFRVDPLIDVVELVRRISESDGGCVEIVDHDLNLRPNRSDVCDVGYSTGLQWHLRSTPIEGEPVIASALIDCEGAWASSGPGHRDIVIGVTDCGCDLSDPNIGSDRLAGWAAMSDGAILSGEMDDSCAQQVMEPSTVHGTLCATLAAGDGNHARGVAPGCRLLPVKLEELVNGQTLSHSSFLRIIEFLSDKVDVVSSSWHIGPNSYWPPAIVRHIQDHAERGGRRDRGIVWVWAAGNHNAPIKYRGKQRVPVQVVAENGGFRVEKTLRRFTNSLAGLHSVLHVGAISSLGQRCHYSNYGHGLDLVAPSANQHSYGRINVAEGLPVNAPIRDGLRALGGTSAATPLVAGVAALVRSAAPTLTAYEVISIMRATADKDLDMSRYEPCHRTGDIPNDSWDVSPIAPFDSGEFRRRHADGTWSPWFGFGKVNARKAVIEAVRREKRHRHGI